MVKKEQIEAVHFKADNKARINLHLLGIAFTVFTLIVTLKPELFRDYVLLGLQLALSIPLFITSTLCRTNQFSIENNKYWNKLAYITFLLAYSMLVNVLGIFLALFVSLGVSMLFFVVNILLAVLYSYFGVRYNRAELKSRLYKDISFIVILILFGIIPSLNL